MFDPELQHQREQARQVVADEWTAIFRQHGLDLVAHVQTTRWDGTGPHPEIWITAPDREASWALLVDLVRRSPIFGSDRNRINRYREIGAS